jgi:aconitate hydratase
MKVFSYTNIPDSRGNLQVGGIKYTIHRLDALEKTGIGNPSKLPFSLKVLLENLLRNTDSASVQADDIEALARWDPLKKPDQEIAFFPSRVLMQDFTGVPAIVDLAAMREAIKTLGGDPNKINPHVPVDLIIDHSIQVDRFGDSLAYRFNTDKEYERNQERYTFLRWGQDSFQNFRVVPPGKGICHQVNLEYLGQVVFVSKADSGIEAFPDTLVGTDSHTTMINSLGILAWGVGGIEAEAAMLNQPISILIPQVIGFRLTGELAEGATATDLVLTVTQILRQKGVVGKFVEYFGSGLDCLTLADRATIANMAPEYGATVGFFPVDFRTVEYLYSTGRSQDQVNLVEAYAKEQGLFRSNDSSDPIFSDTLELDLATVEPSMAGPRRPQDRIPIKDIKSAFTNLLSDLKVEGTRDETMIWHESREYHLHNGAVVIAAITSCTNTSNSSVMVAAGLLAKKAVERGLRIKPWVKASLAPGSKVVTDYLQESGLLAHLEELKFNLVGYGCTTCIGNSGPVPDYVARGVEDSNLVAIAVLSGNRNFEGRINPHTRGNFLMSPPLVVAYALAGRIDIDLYQEPLGEDEQGNPVYLKDIWPNSAEIKEAVNGTVKREMFTKEYDEVFSGDERWDNLKSPTSALYVWNPVSTYIKHPPFFVDMPVEPKALSSIKNARVLVKVGDSLTTDHISPAGAIPADSPAGEYLITHGVPVGEFNSFGSRRGNHEVMMRGTFGNIRLRNHLTPEKEGNWTIHLPSKTQTSIYDAAMKYREEGIPLIVLAGKEYGTGSSRDWAAKGTRLLGVRAVIAESFERIHRSNLIGMGILPLQFLPGENTDSLGLTGFETYSLTRINEELKPGEKIEVSATSESGEEKKFLALRRLDTPKEIDYYRHDGILQYVIRQLL